MNISKQLVFWAITATIASMPAAADTFGLGTASGFAILAEGGLANTGGFLTNGKVGGAAISGFPGSVTTTTAIGGAAGTPAGDFDAAFTTEFGLAAGFSGAALPTTLTPGVYRINANETLPSTLTFNGAGDYIIQVNGNLSDNAAIFNLTDGATADDILFVASGTVQIGANATFDGTIFSGGSVSIVGPTTITGGVFTQGAASIWSGFGSGSDTIDTPTSDAPSDPSSSLAPVPEPGSIGLLALSGIALLGVHRRRTRPA